MHFYPTERIALFIDGANLYATAKSLGFDIDYKRLLAEKGATLPAGYHEAEAAADATRVALEAAARPLVPSHCDPLCENFLDTGQRM